jgi:hypothetical protein
VNPQTSPLRYATGLYRVPPGKRQNSNSNLATPIPTTLYAVVTLPFPDLQPETVIVTSSDHERCGERGLCARHYDMRLHSFQASPHAGGQLHPEEHQMVPTEQEVGWDPATKRKPLLFTVQNPNHNSSAVQPVA